MVAAIFARLGYKIKFLDEDTEIEGKRCEFIVYNNSTGDQIAVEVKSKEREGVLHTKGKTDSKKLLWGNIQRLYRHALKQNPGKMPFIIFIDLNSPQTPELQWDKNPWVEDIKKWMKKTPLHTTKNPDPCTAVIFINYSYHYQTEKEALSGEHLMTIPLHPKYSIKEKEFFGKLQAALNGYGNVPNLDIEYGF